MLQQRFRGARTKALWARVRGNSVSTGVWIGRTLGPLFERTRPSTSGALDRCSFAALVFSEEVTQGTFGDGWIIGARPDSRRASGERLELLHALRFSAEQCSARIPELYPLRNKTAVVLGAGAIGAPIAVELARALISELRVVDPDYVDPAGGVRWLSGFDGAGTLKTTYLVAELARTYPLTRVIPFPLMIGEPNYQPPYTSLEPALEGADIVIDATAEPLDVGRAVADLCARKRISVVAVWSQEGYGGYVARIRPGEGGCHYCLLRAISEQGHIPPPPVPAEPQKSRVQPRGCRAPTYTGSALELAPLSAQAARVAVSTLCAGQPNAYPPISDDVFVLKMRDARGALLTPTWNGYGLPRDPACPVCG
jgi:ThiF family